MTVAKKPVVKKPVVKKPVAKKPVAKKPVAKKPVAKKPVTETVNSNELEKAAATKAGEPWVAILNIELDPANMSNGAVSLDWNDTFIARLAKAGYKGTDVAMVDQWFQAVCRNVIQENWEQEMADADKREEFMGKNKG